MLTLLRRPASALAASPSSHRAASSWSLPSLRSLLGQRGSTAKEEREERNKLQNEAAATAASKSEQPKSLFDTRVEQDAEVAAVVRKTSGAQSKPATFVSQQVYQYSEGRLIFCIAQHKSSTANFKTSRRKLNDLGRLIAGRTADEAILQLKVSAAMTMGFGMIGRGDSVEFATASGTTSMVVKLAYRISRAISTLPWNSRSGLTARMTVVSKFASVTDRARQFCPVSIAHPLHSRDLPLSH